MKKAPYPKAEGLVLNRKSIIAKQRIEQHSDISLSVISLIAVGVCNA